MDNYLTFSNISKIILFYKIKSYNQQNYIHDLFSYCIQHGNHLKEDFDISKTNKWINGKVVIPAEVCQQYVNEEGINRLHQDIEEKIIPNLNDFPMVIDRISRLLELDDTIHKKRKNELLSDSMDSIKLAKIIQFVIFLDKKRKKQVFRLILPLNFVE